MKDRNIKFTSLTVRFVISTLVTGFALAAQDAKTSPTVPQQAVDNAPAATQRDIDRLFSMLELLNAKIDSNAEVNKARFDQLDNKIDSNAVANKANFDRLNSKDESTNTRIDDFIKTIDSRFASIDSRFASIESKLETNYKTIVTFGTIITITIGLVGFLQRRRSPSLSTRTTPSVAPSLESSEVMAESMPKTKSEPESKRDSRA